MKTPVGRWGSLEPRILQDSVCCSGGDFLGRMSPNSEILSGNRAVPLIVFASVLYNVAPSFGNHLGEFRCLHLFAPFI